MNNLVLNTIKKYNLIQNNDKVIVALSGGADSVTLLNVLYSLKEIYNLTLYAAHVNHNLRGDEAKRDENFCKILCKNYNIELFVKSVNVKQLAKSQKISEELCGRNERYSFFEELSQKLNAKVATAHTASDNAETLLFNIARGASVSGVGAIPPQRGNVIRPLIEVTRTQIESYCADNHLDYVTDSTNLEDDYTRNKIRHSVIPVLKELNPKFESMAMHLCENAREVSNYIDKQTEIVIENCKLNFGYDCKKLLSLDNAILKNAIVKICTQNGAISVEQKHISLICDIIKGSGAVDLSNGFTAVAKQNIFRVVKNIEDEKFIELKLENNLIFDYDNKQYSINEINNISDKELLNCINSDLICKNAVFRTRSAGDKFTYCKRNVTKPLRKVLNEMKIPSELRDKILILSIDSTVLWCENIGVSLQGKCNNNSNKALKIDITKKMG